MIPLIVLPLVVDVSPAVEDAFLAVDHLIWAVFAAEYAIKVYLAPNRRRFIARHIPDVVIVLVPMLRPLRVLRSVQLLRLLRLARLAAFAAKSVHETRGILRHRGLNWVLLIVLVLNLVAAAMVLEFERANPGANIDSYSDALWWAVTTITTVGYGDRFPMPPAGRGVAVLLMIAGIAMFGVITATIAAYFVEQKAEEDLADRLDQIMKRLERLETRLPAERDERVHAGERPDDPPGVADQGVRAAGQRSRAAPPFANMTCGTAAPARRSAPASRSKS